MPNQESNKDRGRPTLKDVAAYAGVSTATVTRVLHNNGYVAEETRQRVEQALTETNYHLNVLAQSLRRQRTHVIGHILTSLLPNPFFAGVEVGVEEVAVDHGYNVIIWNALGNAQRERDGVEALIQRQVEAVIFTTPRDPANVQLALNAGRQVVQVERPTHVQTHKILVDNYSGSSAAMQHLLALGHRHIGYLANRTGSDAPKVVESQRYSGYIDALNAANGVTPNPDWVIFGLDAYSIEDGYNGAKQLLENDPNLTAILVFSDIMAAGVLQALYDLRLRVPDEISVIGFDNTYAPYLTPPLTTVAMPMFDVGRRAAQVAIDALEERLDLTGFVQQTLTTELIVRRSTAAPPTARRL